MEMEKKIIGNMLIRPEVKKMVVLEAKWFEGEGYKELASVFAEQPDLTSLEDVAKAVKEKNPLSLMGIASELRELATEGTIIDTLNKTEKMLNDLKIGYHEKKVVALANQVAKSNTKRNMNALKDAMMELEEAKRPKDDGKLTKAYEELKERINVSVPAGVKTYGKLDLVLGGGMKGGQLITIGARPGVGKTAFAVNLAQKVLDRNPAARVDIFTLEMKKRSVLERFITLRTGVDTLKVQHAKDRATDAERKILSEQYANQEKRLRIYDDVFNLDEMISIIRRNQSEAQHGYVAFIDYLGLITVENDRKPPYERVSEITRKMKILTNEYDIPVVLLSQLNRGIESRREKRPMLSDLRDSGSVEQDSNIIAFLWSEEMDNGEEITYLDIQKNREGTVGRLRYRFDKKKMLFDEIFV